jgi:hypothetical protein
MENKNQRQKHQEDLTKDNIGDLMQKLDYYYTRFADLVIQDDPETLPEGITEKMLLYYDKEDLEDICLNLEDQVALDNTKQTEMSKLYSEIYDKMQEIRLELYSRHPEEIRNGHKIAWQKFDEFVEKGYIEAGSSIIRRLGIFQIEFPEEFRR